MPERARIEEIAEQTLTLPAEQREAFLDQACGGDNDLRQALKARLADKAAISLAISDTDFVLEDIEDGDTIGPFRILQRLGEGGMGVVYLAQQDAPIQRRVAIKVVKLGMDTKEVLGRFNMERQALALMSHPNVAAVFDAGATEKGRPYFVMEYVAGVPITEYCDQHRLSVPDRLSLFVQACQGVQHAHQKGIIHRDIKSSNVLVTEKDSRPLVKIIDFGVAKSTQQKLVDNTIYTALGVIIGTPNYMSPEQAGANHLDLDTRTDVYSLGILLYELLVGRLPFDPDTFRNKPYAEIQRVIREVDPPTPVARLAQSEDSARVAHLRHTDLRQLRRNLRGDLSWIVQRATEKDRNQRYPSVSALAEDIGRFLEHRPVEARRHGLIYQTRKFVQRHKRLAVAAAIVFFSLAIALTQALISRHRIAQEAAMAEATNALLTQVLSASDPNLPAHRDQITVAQVTHELEASLDRGDAFIRSPELSRAFFLGLAPQLEEKLRQTLGEVYSGLEQWQESERNLGKAAQLSETINGPLAAMTLRAKAMHANAVWRLGERERAIQELEPIIAFADKRDLSDDQLRAVIKAMSSMSYIVFGQSSDKALEWQERALSASLERFGAADEVSINELMQVSALHQGKDHFKRAVDLARQAQEAAGRLQPPHPDLLVLTASNLGLMLSQDVSSAPEEGIALCELAVRHARDTYGEKHIISAKASLALGRSLLARGWSARALEALQSSRQVYAQLFGEQSPRVQAVDSLEGIAMMDLDRLEQANELFEKQIAQYLAAGDHLHEMVTRFNLAGTLSLSGKPGDALASAKQAADGLKTESDSSTQVDARVAQVDPLIVLGKLDEAKELLKQAISIDPNDVAILFYSAMIAMRQGDLGAAKDQIMAATRQGQVPYKISLGQCLLLQAEVNLRLGNRTDALRDARLAIDRRTTMIGPDDWWISYGKLIEHIAAGETEAQDLPSIIKTIRQNGRPNTLEGQNAESLIREHLPKFSKNPQAAGKSS